MGSDSQKRKMQKEAPDNPDTEMAFVESTAGSTKVEYSPGEDDEKSTISFSTPLTSDLMDQVNKITEEI